MFSAYKVLENREKDKIDEVSVLKYTENQYAETYIKCTEIVNGNILIKFQFLYFISNFTELRASTTFQGVTDPSQTSIDD